MIKVQGSNISLEGDITELLTDAAMVLDAVYDKVNEEFDAETAQRFISVTMPQMVLSKKNNISRKSNERGNCSDGL